MLWTQSMDGDTEIFVALTDGNLFLFFRFLGNPSRLFVISLDDDDDLIWDFLMNRQTLLHYAARNYICIQLYIEYTAKNWYGNQ